MQYKSGFTIIETLVIVVVISILIGIGALVDSATRNSYRSARDNERAADISSIKTIFEQYYRNNNGTYPDTPKVTPATINAIIPNLEIVTAPGMSSVSLSSVAVTTALSSGDITSSQYRYQPFTLANALCTNLASASCVRYKLYYEKELDGQLVVVESSHQQ